MLTYTYAFQVLSQHSLEQVKICNYIVALVYLRFSRLIYNLFVYYGR